MFLHKIVVGSRSHCRYLQIYILFSLFTSRFRKHRKRIAVLSESRRIEKIHAATCQTRRDQRQEVELDEKLMGLMSCQ